MGESLKQPLKDYRFCKIPSQQEIDKISNAYMQLLKENAELQAEQAELLMKHESLKQQAAALTRQLSFYQKNS